MNNINDRIICHTMEDAFLTAAKLKGLEVFKDKEFTINIIRDLSAGDWKLHKKVYSMDQQITHEIWNNMWVLLSETIKNLDISFIRNIDIDKFENLKKVNSVNEDALNDLLLGMGAVLALSEEVLLSIDSLLKKENSHQNAFKSSNSLNSSSLQRHRTNYSSKAKQKHSLSNTQKYFSNNPKHLNLSGRNQTIANNPSVCQPNTSTQVSTSSQSSTNKSASITNKVQAKIKSTSNIQLNSKQRVILLAAIIASLLIIIMLVTIIMPNYKYNSALKLFNNGQYEQATKLFEELDGFKDSLNYINESKYEMGNQFFSSGKYAEAKELFKSLGTYKNSQEMVTTSCIKQADLLYESGDLAGAAIDYFKIDDAKAKEKSRELWNKIIVSRRKPITVNCSDNDGSYVFGITNDGHVKVVADDPAKENNLKCNVENWNDIVQIAAGATHTVGLKSDGTVIATGSNKNGECNVSNWTNVIQVSTDADYTAALKDDGTVLITNEKWQSRVSNWRDIVEIAACDSHILGLKADGTVIATCEFDSEEEHSNIDEWESIVSINVSYQMSIGVTRDGKVLTAGRNNGFDIDEKEIGKWDCVSDCQSKGTCVALKKDGTLLQTVENISNELLFPGLSSWKDIVYFSRGLHIIAGVQSDGTILVLGSNKRSFSSDISSLTNIKMVEKVY